MINAGWEYSNNDVCFPCNLIIGQFICALKSGKYDTAKTALLLPQTGGGCRACNYIMLLRKALLKAGLQNVPVVSLNVSGVEKHSGFSITPKMVLTACAAIYYSDLLLYLYNELSPYELKRVKRLIKSAYGTAGCHGSLNMAKQPIRSQCASYSARYAKALLQ